MKLSDLKSTDLSQLSGLARATKDLTRRRQLAELAEGPLARGIYGAAEQYRAALEPSASLKSAIAGLAGNPPRISQAQHEMMVGLSGRVRVTEEIRRLAQAQSGLTSGVRATAENQRYAREQLEAMKASRLSISASQTDVLRSLDLQRFTVPSAGMLAARFKDIDQAQFFTTNRVFGVDVSQARRAAEAMRSPWVDAANSAASVSRFTELYGMGRAIGLDTSYSEDVAKALRTNLGDWRDPIGRNLTELSEIAVRTAFYEDRGLNRELTDLPEEAFEECLDVAEIRREPPPLVSLYGSPISSKEDPVAEDSYRRNNQVHDWLQRFETQIRRFIDEQMTRQCREDWPARRLPNGMLDKWLEKQNKDPNRDRHSRIIVYADFTDYESIICKRDNFREVFSQYFQRPENFRESMQRLAVPRIEVMHARILTFDDELLIFSELRRLSNQFLRRH